MSRLKIKKMGKERREQQPGQVGDQQPTGGSHGSEAEPFLDPDRMRRFVQAFIKNRRRVLEKLFELDKRNNE